MRFVVGRGGAGPGRVPPGAPATYKNEPQLDVYWYGDDGHAQALAAKAQLAGRPGIVSLEVNTAIYVPLYPPGSEGTTLAPGTVPPTTVMGHVG